MNSKLLREVLQNASPEVQAESTRAAKEITAATYAAVPLSEAKLRVRQIQIEADKRRDEFADREAATDHQKEIDRLREALETIASVLPRFRDAFDRPSGPLKGHAVWLHDYIGEALHPDAKHPTTEEVLEALGESSEHFANTPFTSNGGNLA